MLYKYTIAVSLKSTLVFAVLFFVACGCVPSIYQVVNEQSYQKAVNLPNQKKIIFINSEQVPNSDQWVTLLNKKRGVQIDDQLKQVKDANTYAFLQSIRLLLEMKYALSLQKLNSLPDTAFDCQAMLLKTDCLYMLQMNSVDFRDSYQKVFDCSQNEKIKSIAETRYRFVKYGY